MRSFAIVAAVGMLAITATAVAAQVQSPVPCSYDDCAVRHEARLFSENLVRGTGGDRILKIGFTGGNAADYLSRVDAAAVPARRFKAQRTRGAAFGIVSGILMGVFATSAGDWGDADDFPTTEQGALLLGSVVTAIVSGIETTNSRNSLSRAIWDFNRAPVR